MKPRCYRLDNDGGGRGYSSPFLAKGRHNHTCYDRQRIHDFGVVSKATSDFGHLKKDIKTTLIATGEHIYGRYGFSPPAGSRRLEGFCHVWQTEGRCRWLS